MNSWHAKCPADTYRRGQQGPLRRPRLRQAKTRRAYLPPTDPVFTFRSTSRHPTRHNRLGQFDSFDLTGFSAPRNQATKKSQNKPIIRSDTTDPIPWDRELDAETGVVRFTLGLSPESWG